MTTILVTARTFGSGSADPKGWLERSGLAVQQGDPRHQLERLRAPLADAVGWITGTAPIRAEHLRAAPRLRVIARYGVGVDNVDLGAAARSGVIVTNTPGANTDAVADLALALMLAALRHIDNAVRAPSDWSRSWLGRELGALTVGLIGVGAVGRAVAVRLSGFGSRVLGYDPYVPVDRLHALGIVPVSDALQIAARGDVVSLHAPGGNRIVDKAFLARMPDQAVLVNTARGDLVDEQAVADALRTGRLATYAADVLAADTEQTSPLLDAPHALITRHIGAQTIQAVDRMGMAATRDVLAVLAGERPLHPVPVEEST